jgi:hypothetical protein
VLDLRPVAGVYVACLPQNPLAWALAPHAHPFLSPLLRIAGQVPATALGGVLDLRPALALDGDIDRGCLPQNPVALALAPHAHPFLSPLLRIAGQVVPATVLGGVLDLRQALALDGDLDLGGVLDLRQALALDGDLDLGGVACAAAAADLACVPQNPVALALAPHAHPFLFLRIAGQMRAAMVCLEGTVGSV